MWWDRITWGYKISQIKAGKTETQKKKQKKKNGPFPEVKSSSWLLILSDFLKDFLADETIEQDSNVWPRSTEVAS